MIRSEGSVKSTTTTVAKKPTVDGSSKPKDEQS